MACGQLKNEHVIASCSTYKEAALLALHLSISNAIVSTKYYYKRDDFDLKLSIFQF